jgi:hypothetical protein
VDDFEAARFQLRRSTNERTKTIETALVVLLTIDGPTPTVRDAFVALAEDDRLISQMMRAAPCKVSPVKEE